MNNNKISLRFQSGLVHLLILPIAMALLVAGYFFWKTSDQKYVDDIKNTVSEKIKVDVPTPTPTPFEFQEMTISNLRSRLYESRLSDLEKVTENVGYTSYLTSYTSDGFKVNGLLTIPKNINENEKFPAIVFVHGYIPPSAYKTLVNYASYVDYLAKNGFVVFKIDLRGHADSEGEAGGAYYSEDYVVDTLNAVEALKNSDFVDPERIGLWGHSMAGNVTFRSFVVSQNTPAIVIWAGAGYTYEDLQSYRIQDNSYRPPAQDSQRTRDRQRLRDLYGNYEKGHWFWEQVVPTNYLEGITGALQINHAVNDDVVSIEYSRNLMKVLDDTEIKHELIEYPAGGHNLTGSSFTQAMQNTAEFFEKYL